MNRTRRRSFTALFLALAMALTLFGYGGRSALAADVPSSWAQAEIDEARAKGLITSPADENYLGNISRVLFCIQVVNMVETALGTSVTVTEINPFNDVDNEYVTKAYQLGIVNGKSATIFDPSAFITRQEIAAMMMRSARALDLAAGKTYAAVSGTESLSFADQDEISSWALSDVRAANGLGIMKGVGSNRINPLGNTTVQESILLVNRLYDGFMDAPAAGTGSGTGSVTNAAPEALDNPVEFSSPEQTELIIEADELASDDDGDILTVIAVNGHTAPHSTPYGTAELTSDGKISYISEDISAGVPDDFVVTVSDGTDTVFVNVRVNLTVKFVLVFTPSLNSVSVTGSPAMNNTLRAGLISYVGGIPSPAPALSYQWMSASSSGGVYSAISGATASAYVIPMSAVGKYLKLQVTASGSAGGTVLSAAIGPVTYGFAGGSGSSADPYQIATAEQLMLLNSVPTKNTYFKLTADIALGTNETVTSLFNGVLYGYAHTVTLDISGTDADYVGLFSKISDTGTVNGVNITGTIETENSYVGGITGYNAGSIIACMSSVSIRAQDYAGGLAGINTGTITASESSSSLEAHNYIGGIAGRNTGTVSRSSATDDCSVDANAMAGGAVGVNGTSGCTVIYCFSGADVFANGNEGGLVGWNEGLVADSYSFGNVAGYNNIGGLVGHVSGGSVSRSYYDKETSGQNDTGRGIPKTTAEMQTKSTYAGWDFDNVWKYSQNTYPSLR